MMNAFIAMMGDITWADVADGQAEGVLSWHSVAARAARCAQGLDAQPQCLQVTFSGSHTHRTWRMSANSILDTLLAQVDEARTRRSRAERETSAQADKAAAADADAREAAQRAETHRAEAEQARRDASAARRLASLDPQYADGFLAQAAQHEARADMATRAAGEAGQEAERRTRAAEGHRDKGREQRSLARQLLNWEEAALDAHGTGTNLISDWQPVALRMFEGIQAAGGVQEVPKLKWYLTTAGADLATAGIGGGR